MRNTAYLIGARISSGISGYLILSFAANQLSASQFATLSTVQAGIFLSLVFVDSGITQYAVRETAGNPEWQEKANRFQNIRITIHITLALGVALVHLSGLLPSAGTGLIYATAMMLLSNALVMDWLLFSRDEKSYWSVKALVTSGINVTTAVTLLFLLDLPEAVLLGVTFSNIAGWLYLRTKYPKWSFAPALPTRSEITRSSQLAATAIVCHTAYNAPLLIASILAGDKVFAIYALLYRLFSASTMFIPTLVEFKTAKEIAKIKKNHKRGHLEVFSHLGLISLLVCSPILLLPNNLIYAILSAAIEIERFQIETNHLDAIKIALLLYCADFASQRTAYIFDQRKTLVTSGIFGVLIAATVLAFEILLNHQPDPFSWFHPLFAYQATSTSLVLITMTISRRRELIQ